MSKPKPVVVYLHRYPPEIESVQWPAYDALRDALKPAYDLTHVCMRPMNGQDSAPLRRDLRVVELPFAVDQASGRDKWIKTGLWYMHLGMLLRKIKEIDPALIICQEALPFMPGRVVRLGIPTIVATADWWLSILIGHWRWGRRLADWLEAYEVRRWNRPNVNVLTCTKAGARLLARKGVDSDRVVVINMPRNPGAFRPLTPPPARTDFGLDANLKYFAIFGIIRRGKGYEQILDWWKTVAARHPDWRLVIIGGAGGERWCRRQIAECGLRGTTQMTGWLPTKEAVNRWLNVMDALVVPRRNSSDNHGAIPSALFNGLSTGRPVVATGLPGIAEIVRNGVDGFLYTPDDEASFVATLELVVADPVAASQIGMNGLKRADECFNPRHTAQAYRTLIDAMITDARDISAEPN